MTHEDITAIVALLALALPIFTTMGAALGSWVTSRTKASKVQVEVLQKKIDTLLEENHDLKEQNDLLRQQLAISHEENKLLRGILHSHNIKIPPHVTKAEE
jgi:cell division protein FtsB